MTKKGFFREIEDKPVQTYRAMLFFLFLGTVLLWVYTAVPAQEKNAMIYMLMLIVAAFLVGFDVTQAKKTVNVRANFLGKKPVRAALYGAAAIIAISIFMPQALVQPLAVVDPTILGFLFIVVAAPLVEALFFRGIIQPSLVETIEAWLIKDNFVAGSVATVLQSLAFAWFHINIFGATGDFMPYFIFGIIATIGVYAFRSLAFEFSLHGLNNWFAFSAMTAVS